MKVRVYDGSLWCDHCKKCPVVDYDAEAGTVMIHDPAKPENGRMTMTSAEYNALLEHGRPVR